MTNAGGTRRKMPTGGAPELSRPSAKLLAALQDDRAL